VVDFNEWENINEEEMRRGDKVGKPREKIINVHEMIRIAKSLDS